MGRELAELDELVAVQTGRSSASGAGSSAGETPSGGSADVEASEPPGTIQHPRCARQGSARMGAGAASRRGRSSRQTTPGVAFRSFLEARAGGQSPTGYSEEQIAHQLENFMVGSPNIDWSFLDNLEPGHGFEFGQEEGQGEED
jgi:hypothetical protein